MSARKRTEVLVFNIMILAGAVAFNRLETLPYSERDDALKGQAADDRNKGVSGEQSDMGDSVESAVFPFFKRTEARNSSHKALRRRLVNLMTTIHPRVVAWITSRFL